MTDIKCTVNNDRMSIYKYDTDKFKSENVSVYFSLPTCKEKSVARSLLLSVLKRGTEKYPTQRLINERLDELYATLVNLKNQKFDNVQLFGVSADIIYSSYTDGSENLFSEALDVVSQILFHPIIDDKTGMFCEEYLQSEKENYKSIILSQINEPRTYAAIRCREEMFSSLGIIDNLDTMCERIDNTTMKDIYECYQDIMKNAKILVFYVGKRSDEDIAKQINDAFNKECSAIDINRDVKVKVLDKLDEPNIVIEDSDISQSRLIMGFNCQSTWRDDDYYAMLLCNEILGASPISKLMMNVREKLSLCYECSSVYNSSRGAIFVTTGIDRENYDLASEAILAQMEDIRQGRVSEAELDAAKKSIFNVYSAVDDSQGAIERFYLGRLINRIEVDIDTFLRRINELTLDDVIAAAKKTSLHTVYFLRGNEDGEEDLFDE